MRYSARMKWNEILSLDCRVSANGRTWTAARPMLENFFCNEPPRRLDGKRLLMTGEDRRGHPRLLYTDDPGGIADWKDAKIPLIEAEKQPNEPSWFQRRDGTLVMVFRDDNFSKFLFSSYSTDRGESWSRPVRTDFPDCKSRNRAGTLPAGVPFIISNPGRESGRNPLVISLSRDGVTFDRAYVIRNEPSWVTGDGRTLKGTFEYPGAAVWGDSLYVIYSIYKRDLAVTRIPLAELHERRPAKSKPKT